MEQVLEDDRQASEHDKQALEDDKQALADDKEEEEEVEGYMGVVADDKVDKAVVHHNPCHPLLS